MISFSGEAILEDWENRTRRDVLQSESPLHRSLVSVRRSVTPACDPCGNWRLESHRVVCQKTALSKVYAHWERAYTVLLMRRLSAAKSTPA
jgi:hypothetical protein